MTCTHSCYSIVMVTMDTQTTIQVYTRAEEATEFGGGAALLK